MEENLHTVTLTEQKKTCVTAVNEVESVTREKIAITLTNGKRLLILGQNLKMGNFSKQTGVFYCEGMIDEIRYGAAKTPFWGKILK